MQSLSPTSRYLQALNEGTHQPDDVQKEAVDRLETLYQALTAKKSSATPPGGLIARLGEIIRQKRTGRANTGSRAVYVGGRGARQNMAHGSLLPQPAGRAKTTPAFSSVYAARA
ncbi:ATP/GTP-binding protein [Salmonella enterica subsp. enterica]|uniref:ATP/GTP-binding protein n=1 Tax=Salmonella enterica I TaxID=59201 RepID=A0A379VJ90_SALET|nr:ATP/GTP-binding protein [Salmonella enterica subsp. enterica]